MNHPGDNPDADLSRIEVAQFFMRRNQYRQALDQIQQILSQTPNDATALSVLAICLACMSDRSALATAQAAVAADPELAYAHYANAICLWRWHKTRVQVEQAFQTALSLEPFNPSYIAEYASFLEAQGEASKALPWIDHALELDPDYPKWHIGRCSILLALKRNQEAVNEAQIAVGLAPDDANTHAALGTALLASDQYDAASIPLREALRLDPLSAHNQIQFLESLKNRSALHYLARNVEGALAKMDYSHVSLASGSHPIFQFALLLAPFFSIVFQPLFIKTRAGNSSSLNHHSVMALLALIMLTIFVLVATLRSLVFFSLLRYPDIRPLIPTHTASSAIGVVVFLAHLPLSFVLLWFTYRASAPEFKTSATVYALTLSLYFVLLVAGLASTVVMRGFIPAVVATGLLMAFALVGHTHFDNPGLTYSVVTSPWFLLAPMMVPIGVGFVITACKELHQSFTEPKALHKSL